MRVSLADEESEYSESALRICTHDRQGCVCCGGRWGWVRMEGKQCMRGGSPCPSDHIHGLVFEAHPTNAEGHGSNHGRAVPMKIDCRVPTLPDAWLYWGQRWKWLAGVSTPRQGEKQVATVVSVWEHCLGDARRSCKIVQEDSSPRHIFLLKLYLLSFHPPPPLPLLLQKRNP